MVWRCWRGDNLFCLEIDVTLGYITEIVAWRSGDLQIENFMRLSARLLICAMWPPEAHEFDTPDLHDPKQLPTFFSGRWKRGTSPDLTFCLNTDGVIRMRAVINPFPKSQHRHSLIFTPPILPFVKSRPIS